MNKKEFTSKKIKGLFRRWIILLGWFVLFLTIMQTIGIIVHEWGHYGTGRLFGCQNLSIYISGLSWGTSISHVSGWEYCSKPLVVNPDGSRLCNMSTNIISISGLFFALLVFLPLIFLLNNFLKKKLKFISLEKRYFITLIIFVVVMAIHSSKIDLFKIGECLFNPQMGENISLAIDLLQNLMIFPVIILLLYDFFEIIKQLKTKESKI